MVTPPVPGRPPGTRALVLAPTRELAARSKTTSESTASTPSLRTATVFGGVAKGYRRRLSAPGCPIIIACPGRLLDLMGTGLQLRDSSIWSPMSRPYAARHGIPSVDPKIIRALPRQRQTPLFSATLGRDQAITREFLNQPGSRSEGGPIQRKPSPSWFKEVPAHLKSALLLHLLRDPDRTWLVFSR